MSQTEAEKQPSESQRKLLAAAKLLADATARMVEAARLCASEPQVRPTPTPTSLVTVFNTYIYGL